MGDPVAIPRLVPGADLTARPFGSTDLSVVSTNSTIQAGGLNETDKFRLKKQEQ